MENKGYIEFKRTRGTERFSILELGHDYCVVVVEEAKVSQFAKGLKVKYSKYLNRHKTVGLMATVTDIQRFQEGYHLVYFKHFLDRGSWLVEPKTGTRASQRYYCPVPLAPVCYTEKYKNILGTLNFRILSFSSSGFLLSLDGFSCPFWTDEEFKIKIFLPGTGLLNERVRVCYVTQRQSINGRFQLGVQLVNASDKAKKKFATYIMENVKNATLESLEASQFVTDHLKKRVSCRIVKSDDELKQFLDFRVAFLQAQERGEGHILRSFVAGCDSVGELVMIKIGNQVLGGCRLLFLDTHTLKYSGLDEGDKNFITFLEQNKCLEISSFMTFKKYLGDRVMVGRFLAFIVNYSSLMQGRYLLFKNEECTQYLLQGIRTRTIKNKASGEEHCLVCIDDLLTGRALSYTSWVKDILPSRFALKEKHNYGLSEKIRMYASLFISVFIH